MRFIAFDTETHPIKPGCVAPRLVCVTVDDGIRPHIYDRVAGLARMRALLEDPDVTLIGHWIFFDLCVLAAEDESFIPLIFAEINAGRIRDTKIRQMIVDNAEGKLKFVWNEEIGEYNKQNYQLYMLVMRHLHRDIKHLKKGDDAWRLRYNELDGLPVEEYPPEATAYAIGDAVDTRAIFFKLEDYCEPHGLPGGLEAEIIQTQAAWALYLAGAWGVRTDAPMVAKLKAEVLADYQAAVKTAQAWGFIRRGKKESRNIAAIRAAVETWYGDRQRPIKWTTGGKTGQPQIGTDREQLTGVECSGCGGTFQACGALGADTDCTADGIHRGLWAVAEVVRLSKLLSTYISALERGVTLPLCASYNSIIETFRTSCSQGMKIFGVPMGCNLQNPPRKHGVRECFVPRAGSIFAFCDLDTIEMRTLAQTCIELFGFSDIAEAIKAGRDLHLALAAELLQISYEEAEARYLAGDVEIADVRQTAKIANYGFAGGMAAATFVAYAKGFGMVVDPKLAKKLHSAFRSTWSEMPRYFNYISSLMGDGGRAQVITFPKSNLMRGDVNYTAAANGFFQHRAAMGAKAALYQVSYECYVRGTMPDGSDSPLYGCRPWLFAHDEIGIEILYVGKRASDAALRLQTVMINEMSRWCPDVPIGATACMTRRWYKGAKAVFVDARGEICKSTAAGAVMVPSRPEGKKWIADFGDERMAA